VRPERVTVCDLAGEGPVVFFADNSVNAFGAFGARFQQNVAFRVEEGGQDLVSHGLVDRPGFEFSTFLDATSRIVCADTDGAGGADLVFVANLGNRDRLYRFW
jgi:hypothetical protein